MNGKWSVSYTAHLKAPPEDINALKERVANLMNALECGKSEMVRRIFEAGLSALETQCIDHEGLDSSTVAIAHKVIEIGRQEARLKRLERIYESLGLDEFIAWCDESGIDDYQKFLDSYTWRTEDLRWSKRAKSWLREFLSDGEEYSTDQIRYEAEAAGLLDGTGSDWGRLRTLASRMGYTRSSRHGYWRYEIV